MTTKTTTTTKKKPAQKRRKTAARRTKDSFTPQETKILICAAQEAYKIQTMHGVTDQPFDAWRREQTMIAVSKAGFTHCVHADWKPLLAHFQTLAGKDAEALSNLFKSGRVRDKGPAEDTHESRAVLAHQIMDALQAHIDLCTLEWPQLLDNWSRLPDPPDQKWICKAMLRKEHAEKDGPIREGYLVSIVKNKTRRPDLNLGKDLKAGLAERCTVKQLTQIRDTLINRINAREGVGDSKTRNKSQRRKPKPADAPPDYRF